MLKGSGGHRKLFAVAVGIRDQHGRTGAVPRPRSPTPWSTATRSRAIAAANGITAESLASWNGLSLDGLILEGQTIQVPSAAELGISTTTTTTATHHAGAGRRRHLVDRPGLLAARRGLARVERGGRLGVPAPGGSRHLRDRHLPGRIALRLSHLRAAGLPLRPLPLGPRGTREPAGHLAARVRHRGRPRQPGDAHGDRLPRARLWVGQGPRARRVVARGLRRRLSAFRGDPRLERPCPRVEARAAARRRAARAAPPAGPGRRPRPPPAATPCFAASSRTRSITTPSGTAAGSWTLVDTCARSPRSTPRARTPGSPPPDSRSSAAIAAATARSSVSSSMLKAASGGRAVTSVAPAVGCGAPGPKSGARSPAASARRAPRCRRGESRRARRAPERSRGSPYRNTGRPMPPSSAATASASSRALARARRHRARRPGRRRAPRRTDARRCGRRCRSARCTPWRRRPAPSIRSTQAPRASAPCGCGPRRSGGRAGRRRPNAAAIAAIVSGSRPSEKLGTESASRGSARRAARRPHASVRPSTLTSGSSTTQSRCTGTWTVPPIAAEAPKATWQVPRIFSSSSSSPVSSRLLVRADPELGDVRPLLPARGS